MKNTTIILLTIVLACIGCKESPQSTTKPTSFPMVDYHIHLKGGLTLDQALAILKTNGVKFGIAQNCAVGFPVTDDAGLYE